MKLKLTGLLLTLLIPLGLSSQALAGHHEKEEASDPLAAAAEFPLTMRRTTLIVRDIDCLLYTSPSPRDISGSRMPSSA